MDGSGTKQIENTTETIKEAYFSNDELKTVSDFLKHKQFYNISEYINNFIYSRNYLNVIMYDITFNSHKYGKPMSHNDLNSNYNDVSRSHYRQLEDSLSFSLKNNNHFIFWLLGAINLIIIIFAIFYIFVGKDKMLENGLFSSYIVTSFSTILYQHRRHKKK